ncbi:MAG TPA: HAMP domain-containing sensor histidine kinase [Phycisphaerae bacterium]|nr:HAMP domain-containing sensor histidine kinase [Phycisphaerae bacterium]
MHQSSSILVSTSQFRGGWLVLALILAAVLVPTACVLWFANIALKNEELAVRQRFMGLYTQQLTTVRDIISRDLNNRVQTVFTSRAHPEAEAFAAIVQAHAADGVLLFDQGNALAYPILNASLTPPASPLPSSWPDAETLESQNHWTAAAGRWAATASAVTNPDLQALALRNQARCLATSGGIPAAIAILNDTLQQERFATARDPGGNLIAPAAQLRAVELLLHSLQSADQPANALFSHINRYDGPPMPSPQRLFLMRQLQSDTGKTSPFLQAEALSLQAAETFDLGHPFPGSGITLQPTSIRDVWGLDITANATTPPYRSVILYRTETLRDIERHAMASASMPANLQINLFPDPVNYANQEGHHHLLEMNLGVFFGDHNIGLALVGGFDDPVFTTASRQRSAYLWTATLTIAAITALGLLLALYTSRQLRLARLKNDLIATVSHELKTPLSSMRLLTDTLLEHRTTSPQQSDEYLALISRENTRLSRLIDNFLTFSRMERNKHRFDFTTVNLETIIHDTLAALPERTPAITTQIDATPDRPLLLHADPEALITLLSNLLDNAWKYSNPPRKIEIHARRSNSQILLSVSDNGIGIPRRYQRKIFKRFYQIDQSLSRKVGGTGLGLSLVQFIATAHHATISLDSTPEMGSTFTLAFPLSTKD